MYQEKFLEVIRHAPAQDGFFICGKVLAEMKKTTMYNVDILINNAGTVMETQCDCAVGMGPGAHCKHVQVVLLAISLQKEGIQTRETCTQVLQTFHQTKAFKGSPLKMGKAILRRGDAPIQALPEFDPRPAELVQHPDYNRSFKMVWLNDSGHDLPIRQMFPPANIYAVCHDHQYTAISSEERLLRSLKVSCVTSSDVKEIEKSTREQAASSRWKQERQLRLQSSNFGRICKATDRTNFNLLAENLANPPDFKSKATDYGRKHEGEARRAFEVAYDVQVEESGIWIHPEHPFLGCSPDGLVGTDDLLEIKCPFSAKDSGVSAESVKYLIPEGGRLTLDRRHEYYHQIQGQMLCTGRSSSYFLVWSPKNFIIEKIPRDPVFITSMLEKLSSFYDAYFKPQLLQKYLYRHTDQYSF